MSALRICLIAGGLGLTAAAPASACDRSCLTALAERYMDAMVAHAPASLPWAGTVKSSENSVAEDIGDGLWGSITAHSPKGLEAADPQTGDVAWMGEVEEHGQPSFFALRLHVENGKIAEAETVVRRKGGPPQYGDPANYAHDPAFGQTEPTRSRLSRKRLTALVSGYFDSLQRSDGTARTRFALDCARQDNGVNTTAGAAAEGGVEGCAAQIKAGVFKAVGRVREQRLPVVDEAKGVVIATGFLDYPDRAETYVGSDGKARPAPAKYPFSIGFITAFKIQGGAIARIDSISDAQPYLMPRP